MGKVYRGELPAEAIRPPPPKPVQFSHPASNIQPDQEQVFKEPNQVHLLCQDKKREPIVKFANCYPPIGPGIPGMPRPPPQLTSPGMGAPPPPVVPPQVPPMTMPPTLSRNPLEAKNPEFNPEFNPGFEPQYRRPSFQPPGPPPARSDNNGKILGNEYSYQFVFRMGTTAANKPVPIRTNSINPQPIEFIRRLGKRSTAAIFSL